MPVYEWQCRSCDKKLEVTTKMELRDVPVYCELCNEPMIRLCANSGGFRLKGGGWADEGYATIYGDGVNFKAGRKIYK